MKLFSYLIKPISEARVNVVLYLFILFALVAAGVWMSTVQISSAVIVKGSVKLFQHKITLQHPEGGRIGEVHVIEGDDVQTGQPILTLINTNNESLVRGLERQLLTEEARLARLRSEMGYPDVTMLIPQSMFGEVLTIWQVEKNLNNTKITSLNSQLNSVRQQLRHASEEVDALETVASNDRAQVARSKELADQGFVAQTSLVSVEQALNTRMVEIARVKQKVAELEQRLITLVDDFRNAAASEYRVSSERLLEIEERLRPAIEVRENLVIRSPTQGRLVNLTKLGTGSVLGSKETIAEVIPEGRSMIVEGSLSPEQVAFVSVGMPVTLRSFQLSKLGLEQFEGRLSRISADSVSQGALGTSAYVIQVDIEDLADPLMDMLRLGMPIDIYLQTGTRTPLAYLIDPVKMFLHRAARE